MNILSFIVKYINNFKILLIKLLNLCIIAHIVNIKGKKMTSFFIDAKTLQNVAREKMLAGHFESACKVLRETLVGISKEQIDLILNGDYSLENKDGGIEMIKEESEDYKKFLSEVKNEIENSEYKRKQISREELKKDYQINHYEFVNHQTDERVITFPKVIMDNMIGKETEVSILDFNGMTAKEQFELLIGVEEKEANEIANEIKIFGYQVFSDFSLFRENNAFGRLTGVVKKLEDKNTITDTDILFLDLEDRETLLNHYRLFEKAGAVIAYSTMTKLLAHIDIFRNSKEAYEQTPLLLIHRSEKAQIEKLYKKKISINFKKDIISAL